MARAKKRVARAQGLAGRFLALLRSRDSWSRLALATVSGVAWFLACADFDIWPLAWVAMVPTLWAIRDLPPRKAFLLSWYAGTVANMGGFYWIVGLLERFGNLPLAAALPLFVILMAYHGLEFGLWGWWLALVRRRGPVPVTWVGPVLMVAVEMIIPFIFPWYLAITQAWVVPVIQVADLTGPVGVTFLLLLVNCAVFELLAAWKARRRLPWKHAAGAAAVLAASLVYGQIRIHQVRKAMARAPKVKVGIVQANIGIKLKGAPGFRRKQLEIHRELSRFLEAEGAELLVWPESSYPYVLPRHVENEEDLEARLRIHEGFRAPVFFGLITADWPEGAQEARKVYNSAVLVDESGRFVGLYDKIFLLVFGEYIPFYDELSFMRRFFRRHRMSNFDRGERILTFPYVRRDGTYRLGPLICYEDIIPSFGRKLAKHRPHLLVNVTNDAWFGDTSEPYEHLALAVYRSVELRLAMVRSVNTGVSALVLPTGRVAAQAPATGSRADETFPPDPAGDIRRLGYEKVRPGLWRTKAWPQAYALLSEAPLMDPPHTVYAAVGDLFGYLNLLLAAWLLFFHRRRLWRKVRLLGRPRKGDGEDRESKPRPEPGGSPPQEKRNKAKKARPSSHHKGERRRSK